MVFRLAAWSGTSMQSARDRSRIPRLGRSTGVYASVDHDQPPLTQGKESRRTYCWARPFWHELLDSSQAKLDTRTPAENWLAELSEDDQIIGCIDNASPRLARRRS